MITQELRPENLHRRLATEALIHSTLPSDPGLFVKVQDAQVIERSANAAISTA